MFLCYEEDAIIDVGLEAGLLAPLLFRIPLSFTSVKDFLKLFVLDKFRRGVVGLFIL